MANVTLVYNVCTSFRIVNSLYVILDIDPYPGINARKEIEFEEYSDYLNKNQVASRMSIFNM